MTPAVTRLAREVGITEAQAVGVLFHAITEGYGVRDEFIPETETTIAFDCPRCGGEAGDCPRCGGFGVVEFLDPSDEDAPCPTL